jgi:hypothetical protein
LGCPGPSLGQLRVLVGFWGPPGGSCRGLRKGAQGQHDIGAQALRRTRQWRESYAFKLSLDLSRLPHGVEFAGRPAYSAMAALVNHPDRVKLLTDRPDMTVREARALMAMHKRAVTPVPTETEKLGGGCRES